MDHVINALEPFYEVNLEIVTKEYESGKYEEIKDCPTFKELKAITDAMNSLRRYLGWRKIDIHEEILVKLAY